MHGVVSLLQENHSNGAQLRQTDAQNLVVAYLFSILRKEHRDDVSQRGIVLDLLELDAAAHAVADVTRLTERPAMTFCLVEPVANTPSIYQFICNIYNKCINA